MWTRQSGAATIQAHKKAVAVITNHGGNRCETGNDGDRMISRLISVFNPLQSDGRF